MLICQNKVFWSCTALISKCIVVFVTIYSTSMSYDLLTCYFKKEVHKFLLQTRGKFYVCGFNSSIWTNIKKFNNFLLSAICLSDNCLRSNKDISCYINQAHKGLRTKLLFSYCLYSFYNRCFTAAHMLTVNWR